MKKKVKVTFDKIASYLQKIENNWVSIKMAKEGEIEKLYDVVVIGGGPGGYHSAIRAAQYGAKVALIEKDNVGGTCLNRGCIPTKALYSSAKLLEDIKAKSPSFGIKFPADPLVEFEEVVDRKNKLVTKMVGEIEQLLKKVNVDLYKGRGTILGGEIDTGFDVKVDDSKTEPIEIRGKRVIIATGSIPALIPQFHIDHDRILTSDDILSANFKIVPKTLLVIGGGVIGCEFAYIFSQLGAKVTILEFLDTILATEEKLVVSELKKKFVKLGIEINETMNCLTVKNTGERVEISACSSKIPASQVETAEKSHFTADYCLVSIGREKFTKSLGIENTLIQTDRGRILVDRLTLETDEPGIYAIGDVTGGLMLAHVASYEGDIAVYNALSSIGGFGVEPTKATYEVVPATIFTNPEIGSVGMREKEAKVRGYNVSVGRFAYAALGKAKCEGEEEGFMMVIADQDTDEILGASCIGVEAPELIAEIALAIKNNLTVHDVTETIHSHPTMSELVLETCEDVHGLAIHKARRRREPVVTPIEISPEILATFLFPNMDFKAILRG